MARKAVPRSVRRRVRQRAGRRCEYCQHPDEFACAPFACEFIDHHPLFREMVD